MISSTASDDIYFVESFNILFCPFKFIEYNSSVIFIEAWRNCISYSFWLFINFFEHEMFIAAFFCCFSIPIYFEYFFSNRIAFSISYPNAIFFNYCDFAIIHDVCATSISDDCWNIRSNEVFTITKTDNEWIIFFCADKCIWIILAHEYERVRTFNAV